MADTPQQGQVAAGGEGGGAGEGAPVAKKSKLASFLPLIIAIILMPVAAWVTLEVKARVSKKATSEAEEGHVEPKKQQAADAHGASSAHASSDKKEKGKTAKKSEGRNTKLPVPLTRMPVAFVPRDSLKPTDFDKIVVLDAKGETKDVAESDKIVVNIAHTGGTRYAVARISLLGEHPELIDRLNENRERLLDVATGTMSSKSLEDIEKPGFRNILRAELLSLFGQILGAGSIQEVIVTEFIIQ